MSYRSVLKRGPAHRGFRPSVAALGALVASAALVAAAIAQPPPVREGSGHRLNYERDERGNRIPDFSRCGYAGADRDIPDVPARITLAPAGGDNTARIQAAIDRVSRLPLDDQGFRGAVLLLSGRFEIAGQLTIAASGTVLRGSGAGDGGATLVATGQDRRALVRINGTADRKLYGVPSRRVAADYVPVGADRLPLDSADGLRVGDTILVTRPSTLAWIKELGADAFGVEWKPGTRDLRWDRTIVAIEGDTIALDAPITTAIEARFGGATVERYDWPGRIGNVGIEDLRMESAYDSSNRHDEEHAWHGVTIENAHNAWVRRVEFRHFAGGAVALWELTKHITVEDCIAREPISELAGYRRHTFFAQGQCALFLRCWSEHGRRDFAVGHCAAGPNAFVHCFAANANGDSGPLESWASGVLYDNVRIDGAGLDLTNRWVDPPGTGWSAANCVLWQCRAATIRCDRPPTANNWAIGVWARLAGDGTFAARSDFVRPISLYEAQLRERVGPERAADVGIGFVDPIGSTNPTIAEAARFAEQSQQPAPQLIDVIRARFRRTSDAREPESTEYSVPSIENAVKVSEKLAAATLQTRNGWLVAGDRLITGSHSGQGFWRGTIRPDEAAQLGRAITRFVPGRTGRGFTDDLAQLAGGMQRNNIAVFDHHYGLWYDRRRDDHTMFRQANGNVAPPFYEQPFARTGNASDPAWTGLSKYDLTRFNTWYWKRLREFARQCDERGLVLMHQNYFQHNILEAGAHWADSPWRPANNVNDTGLPEPPPYIGDKRIFVAANFYDVTNPRLRALHRGYIRQCLDNFAGVSNVVQMTSAEFSGPLAFTQFWLDTIAEWEGEQGAGSGEQGRASESTSSMLHAPRSVLLGLSAPKDVQDAILADPERVLHVDVVDIRYWAYTAGNGLYAPTGGQNLAPRQHLRQTRQKSGGFPAIVKAVREYRTRFPDKAVTYYADMHCPSGRDGWAVLIGGGSLANVKLPDELARAIPTMRPTDGLVSGAGRWCLASPSGECLIYAAERDEPFDVDLRNHTGKFRVRWIDTESGEIAPGESIAGGMRVSLPLRTSAVWLTPTTGDDERDRRGEE